MGRGAAGVEGLDVVAVVEVVEIAGESGNNQITHCYAVDSRCSFEAVPNVDWQGEVYAYFCSLLDAGELGLELG